MAKKVAWAFLLGLFVIGVFGGIGLFSPVRLFYNEAAPCSFCSESVIHSQQVYEGKEVRALYNYSPALEGHLLIIPKRHVSRFEDLTDTEIVEMKQTIAKMQKAFEKVYQKSDYILVLQNGPNGGQSVPHTHFHMIPRGSESVMIVKIQLWMHFLTHALGRSVLNQRELQEQIIPLQQALNEF
jgi:histidine triad (HIT) family protein